MASRARCPGEPLGSSGRTTTGLGFGEDGMDIFEIIRDDHRSVMDLMEQLKQTDDLSVQRRSECLRQVKAMLLPHMAGEETLLYPLLDKAGDQAMSRHANDEHHQARVVFNEILYLPTCNDPSFVSRIEQLQRLLQSHIQAEESVIFDEVRTVTSDHQRQEMGRQFQEFKAQCLSSEGDTDRRAA